MTEQEAKKNWCPFSRVANGLSSTASGGTVGYSVFNRATELGEVPNNSMCFASGCMAWRWHYAAPSDTGQRRDTWPDLIPFGRADQLLTRHGFCGLAGDPPPMPPVGGH